MKRFKSLVTLVILISSLTIGLYISFNYDAIEIYGDVFAYKTDQSSISTKESSSKSNSGDMLELLARLINAEARGEPYKGQVAVGAVVMNRVKNADFPDTVSGVIYQKGQFSSVTDGQINKAIDKDSTVYKAAREAMNGSDPTNGCVFFYNPKTAKSKWIFSRKVVVVIGKHAFAK